MGTPETDNSNQKAIEQQQNQYNKVKNEHYKDSNSFSDFDKLDEAIENLMALERDGHVSFAESEAVMEYFDLKLTQKVSRQD